MLPDIIRSKQTGNILRRYEGEPYTHIVHRDEQGNPITTIRINSGDYIGHNESQSSEYLRRNPSAWEPIESHKT